MPAPERLSLRVVLADDTPDIRELVRLILETEGGFEIVGEAGTGRDAVALAETEQPDVVLLDLAMPEMDGLEAIPRIREVSPATKIVVLSGFEEARAATEALALGAAAYLQKGTRPKDLVAKLRGVALPDEPARVEETRVEQRDILPMLTHELRNQVVVVEGFTTMMLKRWDVMPPEQKLDLMQRVARNAQHMHALLDAFADADKVDTGRLDVTPEPADLSALVGEIATDLGSVSETHHVDVSVEEEVYALADPVRIRQIVTNLLSNAAKFSPPGSIIEVAVVGVDGHAEVVVADRGPGVPEDRREELFQPFSRLGVKEKQGTGLGLYISRGIARAHGGDLALAPSDAGARFVLTLPRPLDR